MKAIVFSPQIIAKPFIKPQKLDRFQYIRADLSKETAITAHDHFLDSLMLFRPRPYSTQPSRHRRRTKTILKNTENIEIL